MFKEREMLLYHRSAWEWYRTEQDSLSAKISGAFYWRWGLWIWARAQYNDWDSPGFTQILNTNSVKVPLSLPSSPFSLLSNHWVLYSFITVTLSSKLPVVSYRFNPLNPELNRICYLLALLGAHHFLHVSRIRVKSLTFRLLMSYIYGAPILDVSRSHTTQHSR